MSDFSLPDLGEGLTDARVVEWHVKPGQAVSAGDVLVSVETAKAIVEIPAPFDGHIASLAADIDDVVDVGEPLLSIQTLKEAEGQTSVSTSSSDKKSDPIHHVETTNEAPTIENNSINDKEGLNRTSLGIVGSLPEVQIPGLDNASVVANEHSDVLAKRPLAMPAVRRRARDLGIALQEVTGSGPSGSITTTDLTQAQALSPNPNPHDSSLKTDNNVTGSATNVQIDSDRLPDNALEHQRQLNRQRMSEVMMASREQVVPATVTELADIASLPDQSNLTIVALQALVHAVSIEPCLNAWFDHQSAALQLQDGVHIAVAVDTPTGLYAPVLRDADQRNARGLSENLNQILNRTRAGELQPADMLGATITLSNFGSICGMYADLVVPPPTVAIIGIGRSRELVVSRNDAIVVHRSLPVSLTFNHRAITGGDAARFLKAFVHYLEHLSNKTRGTDDETAI